MRRGWLLALALGCGDTGQDHVELALAATGSAARVVLNGDAQIALTRADIAFGPAYFCASEAGRAELCEVALAEFRGTALVHALDPNPQPLGVLQGTTGNVRSGLYDYGISWLLTENQPRADANAPEGHSALLEGTATRGARSLRFRARIDAKPRMRGDLTVNGQVTRFSIAGDQNTLTIAADPHAWLSQLDVDALFALAPASDGVVEIPADSALYESILQGMLNRAPLRFVWN